MPNIKSAIKRVKVAESKALRNNMIKSEYKTAVKKYEKANQNGEKDAVELLRVAKKKIDSASSKGVISKNAANRKKSKLDKKLSVKAEAKKATKKVAEKSVVKEEVKAEPAKKATTTKKTTTTKKATTAKKTAKKSE